MVRKICIHYKDEVASRVLYAVEVSSSFKNILKLSRMVTTICADKSYTYKLTKPQFGCSWS